jgi:hypothetical protein
VSDYTHCPYFPVAVNAPSGDGLPRVVLAKGSGACRTPTLWDSTGSAVTIRTGRIVPKPVPGSDLMAPPAPAGKPAIPDAPACNMTSATRGDAATTAAKRDWIARYIVTPNNAHRLYQRLQAELGAPIRERGLPRFVRRSGDQALEILLDGSSGAINELRVSERGRLVATVARTYRRQANGFFVLDRERISSTDASGSTGMMDVTYRNIRIAKED